jgi:serine/threonine protein kinase
MDKDRWRLIESTYHAALEREGEARSAFLNEACANDDDLRSEVEALIDQDRPGSSFMESPAFEVAARKIRNDSLGQKDSTTSNSPSALQQIGPYTVLALLGKGGMGEVYRARDTELGRDVAVKVLPPALAQDADRLIRFRREAQLLASLNHVNIACIYGLAEGEDGVRGLVLELVEGETLLEIIADTRQGLPLGQALSIARQIADALDAAHQKGIIHRDLKPANIRVTPSGLVKLLDFGLGKEFAGSGARTDSMATTVDGPPLISLPGMVLGTVGYLSPEQARAEPLDPRTDLFSLGVVLYEMTTGRPPFSGSVTPVIFDAILHKVPPAPSLINAEVPPVLDRIIFKLLEKDRAARYASASEVSRELQALAAGTHPTLASRGRPVWMAIGAVLLSVIVGVTVWQRTRPRMPAPSEYVQVTHMSDSVTSPSLSPDGKTLAFIRGPSTFFGPGQIYVKALPDGEPVQLTNDGLDKMSPVFSPDGSRVAYTTVDQNFDWNTWNVSLVGREPQLWLKNASGLSWTDPLHLLFSEITGMGIHMSLVTTTEDRTQTRSVYQPADEQGMVHRSSLSPDRKSVLLVEMVSRIFKRCRVVPADGSSPGKSAGPDGECTAGAWSTDGRWMYFSVKVNGVFHIWRQQSPDGIPEQLTSGTSEEEGIAITPDGRSLFTSLGTTRSAIWMHDARGDREVSGEGNAFVPTLAPVMSQPFSADGRKLFYLVQKGAQGAGLDQRSGALWVTDLETDRRELVLPGFDVIAYDVSRDRKRIVFAALDNMGRSHLWLARLDGQLSPRQISTLEGDGPRFGVNDDIFFRGGDGTARFIFRIGEDGGEVQKAVAEPILFFMSISPDGAWLVARVASKEHGGNAVVAFSTHDGRAVLLCADCEADWSPGGQEFVIRGLLLQETSLMIALARGESLPQLPARGLRSQADVASLIGVRAGDGLRYPGRGDTVYAYVKSSVQRNIYRVPLP